MGLKSYFETIRLKKFLARQQYERTGFGNQEFQTIGILYDYTDSKNLKAVLQFAEYLTSKNYQVSMLAFCGKQLPQKVSYGTIYQKKDSGFLRFPKKKNVKAFSEFKFDLLINFYLSNNRFLQLISAISPAGLRVASNQTDELIADLFLVNTKKNSLQNMQTQIINYLKL